ncbi:glycosyl transferase [Synechococcus sp. 63AY4M2]|uniref:glycosyltransferase n=1 Tax=unclassified Synechococcus TaxID=2626047 RepID=UPI000C4AFCD4|nr:MULTISPECIES: glycosyltransferase family 2 protein [unclassified Synechococcus]PIK85724.1 glycosyl transferase [Synechococcus sp. 63AY4M2]PIK91070.1 glycosyl transferase [Synechococcus sp. 65AY6Li]
MGIPEILAGVLAPTALAIALVALRLWRALRASPWLRDPSPEQAAAVAAAMERLAVIVPAYNEAENVVGCLSSILDSTAAPLQVWLVDDDSTDATWELAQGLAAKRQDPRLHLLKGDPRPQGQTWVGKNWACAQAVAALAAQPDPPDYLLFLDCDVRLESGAIEAALGHLLASGSGLVSVGPQLVCGCLAEWLVQPIMMVILAAGYDFAAVNDPDNPKAFAFGPFMLFRRSAYEQVGGHAGVAEVVIEDVALGQRIKAAGLGLQICLGGPRVRSRMYANGAALWEGWTKNWFLGLERNWALAVLAMGTVLGICSLPWLGVILAGATGSLEVLLASLAGILAQLAIRLLLRHWAHLPLRYWWLTAVGGWATAAIILASAIRTTTGRNWTWRGRSLAVHSVPTP